MRQNEEKWRCLNSFWMQYIFNLMSRFKYALQMQYILHVLLPIKGGCFPDGKSKHEIIVQLFLHFSSLSFVCSVSTVTFALIHCNTNLRTQIAETMDMTKLAYYVKP